MVEVEAHHVAGGQGEVLSHGCAAEGSETGRLEERGEIAETRQPRIAPRRRSGMGPEGAGPYWTAEPDGRGVVFQGGARRWGGA